MVACTICTTGCSRGCVAGELVPLIGGGDVFDPHALRVEAHRLLTLAEQGLTPGDAAFNPIQFKGKYDGYLRSKVSPGEIA